MILQVLIEAIGLLPLLALVAVVVWRRRQLDRDDRRDSITTDLRNLPGHSLQDQFEKLYESRIDKLVLVLSAGLMVALLIATRRIAAEFRPWDWLDTTILIAAIGLA